MNKSLLPPLLEDVCLENIMASCSDCAIPVNELLVKSSDRCSFRMHDDLIPAMLRLEKDGKFKRSRIVHPSHGRVAYSWRQDVWRASMQVNVSEDCSYVVIDHDHFNPERDVLGFMGHLIELIDPRTTNPVRIRKFLIKRGLPLKPLE